jgi:hypothetical protein
MSTINSYRELWLGNEYTDGEWQAARQTDARYFHVPSGGQGTRDNKLHRFP